MPSITVANPRKRKRKTRRKTTRRRRRNPEVAVIENPRRKVARRSNPRLGSIKSTLGQAITAAAPVILGIYVTRYGTRALLKYNDQGYVGYGANLAFAVVLAMIARMLGYQKQAALIATGGVAATGLRVITDYFPQVGAGYTQFADPAGGAHEGDIYAINDYVQGGQFSGMGLPELDQPLPWEQWYHGGGQNAFADYVQTNQ